MTGSSGDQNTTVPIQPPIAGEFNSLPDETQDRIIEQYVERLENEFPAEEITQLYIEQTVDNIHDESKMINDEEFKESIIKHITDELHEDANIISKEDLEPIESRLMKLEDKTNIHTFLNPLWVYRQFILYSVAIGMIILSLRTSNVSLALSGGALLIVTSLHYAD